MILVIDNYDSFTYNLVQYFGELGADPLVKRNDEITLEEIKELAPDRICISPGPCTSPILHDGRDLFQGLPNPFEATRYHSLLVKRETFPDCLEITAETAEGEIMGLRHRELPVWGVQFHPESILTTHGKELLANFLKLKA